MSFNVGDEAKKDSNSNEMSKELQFGAFMKFAMELTKNAEPKTLNIIKHAFDEKSIDQVENANELMSQMKELINTFEELIKTKLSSHMIAGFRGLKILAETIPHVTRAICSLEIFRSVTIILGNIPSCYCEEYNLLTCPASSSSGLRPAPVEVKATMMDLLCTLVSNGATFVNLDQIKQLVKTLCADPSIAVSKTANALLDQINFKLDSNITHPSRSSGSFAINMNEKKPDAEECRACSPEPRVDDYEPASSSTRPSIEKTENSKEISKKADDSEKGKEKEKEKVKEICEEIEVTKPWDVRSVDVHLTSDWNDTRVTWNSAGVWTLLSTMVIKEGIWHCTLSVHGSGADYGIGIASSEAISLPRNQWVDNVKGGHVNLYGNVWVRNGQHVADNDPIQKGMAVTLEIDMHKKLCAYFYNGKQQHAYFSQLPDHVVIAVCNKARGFSVVMHALSRVEKPWFQKTLSDTFIPLC
ncbi:uncharacterized protein MONOS_1189 [Monocercomonoides exilis]|uniref:uncharacterized protein n=1 Tax=Monocercomonoides exilis TaxID=2049356 RepID=UPI003559A780|nr:hypothetical protein MONOS_1189 [Monocercomonoides exilis]|eukprot:MONOS_1189.1-p1 / transcript=MONOS_1189.1 / gene=MONOS_1189 / organism=Monocercomonoides_exilis_PA203 / gene_product=unspecified product / transcript_product=unspecified product / location=Mono_scaffold00020:102541-104109(+) / protein_length=471 / sequence_SO=supercontig / SO=protein_coding / is_pseudo=false